MGTLEFLKIFYLTHKLYHYKWQKQTLMTADHAKECNDKSLTDATAERILACRSKRKEISSIPKDMALCVPIQSSDVLPSGWAVSNAIKVSLEET